jgi:hypothetical protein
MNIIPLSHLLSDQQFILILALTAIAAVLLAITRSKLFGFLLIIGLIIIAIGA